MNVFKRMGLFIFGVAGVYCLLSLGLPWFGPWRAFWKALLELRWYYFFVAGCLGITSLGVLVGLARALFAPKKRKTVVVSRSGSDEVTVTTAAIASQAAHIVESGRIFYADKVDVKVGRRGRAKVSVRVHPVYAVNVTEEGRRLHEELEQGLAVLCGDAVDSISLEFVQADSQEEAPAALREESDAPNGSPIPLFGGFTSGLSSDDAPDAGYEITVPMGHSESSEPQTSEEA